MCYNVSRYLYSYSDQSVLFGGFMKILVIEDEIQLADALCELLKRNMYSVDVCYDGIDGLDNALTGIYDCILLDIMLPGMNGIDVLRNIRQEKISTPILLLTARSEISDKINGLDCGADDYLTKPFSFDIYIIS